MDELQWKAPELQMRDVLIVSLQEQRREALKEITLLRQSVDRARALIESIANRGWITEGVIDDSRKWMEEHCPPKEENTDPLALRDIIASRLRQARAESRFTLREVAAKIPDLSHVTLLNYERGKTSPSVEALVNLAAFYQRDLMWFLSKEENS